MKVSCMDVSRMCARREPIHSMPTLDQAAQLGPSTWQVRAHTDCFPSCALNAWQSRWRWTTLQEPGLGEVVGMHRPYHTISIGTLMLVKAL